jgi:pimeloyl-ACP methyl ester carboxylesterase
MAGTERRTQVKTITANGTELHYVERGEGDPVVFVHGGLGDFRTWLPQVETFSHKYRAISYSRRGHYPNAWPPGYQSDMQQQVDDLAAFIEALHLERPHIVGNSYGSYISLVLASRQPELPRSLSLAEPPVHPLLATLPGGAAMLGDFMERAWLPANRAFQAGDMEEGVRLFIGGAVGPEEWEKLSPRTRQEMMKDAPELAVAAAMPFEMHMRPFTCEDAARVHAPTLLMRGENSPPMYTLINNELARCIPHAEQALVHDAAHVLHAQNPREHDRLVLDFLARHQGR